MDFLSQLQAKRKALMAERNAAIDSMEAATATAAAESRNFLNDDEKAGFESAHARVDVIDAELEKVDARIGELTEHAERRALADLTPTSKAIGATFGANPHQVEARALMQSSPSVIRGHAMTALERMVAPDAIKQAVTLKVQRALNESPNGNGHAMAAWAIASSNPAYFEALNELILRGQFAVLSDEQKRAVNEADTIYRAMGIATDAAGKFGVPVQIDPAFILTNAGYIDPMRKLARVRTIANDKWRGVATAGVTAEWKTEGASVADGSPTLSQPTVTAHLNDVFVPYSVELEGDYGADLVGELARIASDAAAVLEGTAFWTGSGTGQPKGAVTLLDSSTNLEVVVTTDGSLGMVDVRKLAQALPSRWQDNASLAAHLGTWLNVRSLAASQSGTGYWADLAPGVERPAPSLLGYPAIVTDGVPVFTGTTGAANIMVIADFSNFYTIVDRVSAIEFVPHLFDVTTNRPTLQRGFLLWRRTGGDVVVPEAGRLLQNQ